MLQQFTVPSALYSNLGWLEFALLELLDLLVSKSLHIRRAMSIFNGTEIEIWAGFEPVGITEKKFGPSRL